MRRNYLVLLRCAWLGLCPSALIMIGFVLNPFAWIVGVADDGLFFVRYAHNFLASHRFCWNLGEPPSFGATSQLFQLLVTVLQSLCRGAEPLSVLILSVMGGVVTVALLLLLLRRELASFGDLDTAAKIDETFVPATLLLVFGVILIGLNPKMYNHWGSGLETTWSMLLVAGFVAILPALLTSRFSLLLGLPIAILVLFWQRPDLGLVGTMPLMVGFVLGSERKRLEYFNSGLISAACLCGTLFVWKLYYGTPVPLPSIVKTALSPYGKNVARVYGYGNLWELFLFCRENILAFGYCVTFFVLWRRVTRTRFSIADLSLGIGALAYISFQAFGNKYPITSGGSRFFMPVLPILLYFSIRGFSLALKLKAFQTIGEAPTASYNRKSFRIGVVAIVALLVLQGTQLVRHTLLPVLANARDLHFSSAQNSLIAQIRHENKWTHILGQLTDPRNDHCSIADSELGGIGLLPPSRVIFDMSGLNNTDIILHHEPPNQYLLRKLPDYIWYQRVNFYQSVLLEDDPIFKSLYDFHPQIGIANRRGSGCSVDEVTARRN